MERRMREARRGPPEDATPRGLPGDPDLAEEGDEAVARKIFVAANLDTLTRF